MAGFIYLPVASQEMLSFAKEWTDGQTEKNKTPYKVLKSVENSLGRGMARKMKLGCLRGLVAQDKLYLLAHGAHSGSSSIGGHMGGKLSSNGSDWEGGKLKGFSPAQMAETLVKEGLLQSFIDLRVFACGSACIPETQAASFAERLFREMRGAGYAHVRVTGYLGSTWSGYAQRSIGQHVTTPDRHKGVTVGSRKEPASNHRSVFDSMPGAALDE